MIRIIIASALTLFACASSAAAQCSFVGLPGASGCGAFTPFGIPTIRCSGAPMIGNASFFIEATMPCNAVAPLLVLGSCLPTPLPLNGPFGAGGFCGPSQASCLLFVGPSFYGSVSGTSTTPPAGFAFGLPIPADPALQGASTCAQLFSFCTTSGGACLAASNGIMVRVQ